MLLDSTAFGGERFLTGINVIGKPITKVVVKMADVNPTNAPATGAIVAKIKRSSDNVNQATSDGYEAGSLADNAGGASTSNWTDVTLTFTGNTYNMINSDRLQFEYAGGTGGGGGGGGGTLASYYDYLNQTRSGGIVCDSITRPGEKVGTLVSLIGDKITSVVAKMCDPFPSTAPASGTITARICSSTGTSYATASGSLTASQVADNTNASPSGSWSDVSFTFDNTNHTIAVNDCIQFEYRSPRQRNLGRRSCLRWQLY